MAKKRTFQQALSRLEEITSALEDTRTSIEDSLKLYKEAAELFAFCNASLTAAETEVTALRRTASAELVKEPWDEEV